MPSFNQAEVIGHVGSDPVIRETPSGAKVANFSVATKRSWQKNGEWQNETTWHRITQWGPGVDKTSERMHKGSLVHIVGRIEINKYKDSEGNDKEQYNIVANIVNVLDKVEGQSIKDEVDDLLKDI